MAVIDFNNPIGPVRSSPRARARTAVRSVSLREVVYFASLGIKLMPVIFSVTMRPSPPVRRHVRPETPLG